MGLEISESELKKLAEKHGELFSCVGESCQTFFSHLKRASTEIFVHRDENKIVGYALLKNEVEEKELSWLAVFPENQGRGFGRAILEHVCREAIHEGKKKIICYGRERFKKALGLYQAQGFKVVNQFTGRDGDLMIKLEICLSPETL